MTTLKATVAGIIAMLTYAVPVVDDGVKPSEIVYALLLFVGAWQAVYWTPGHPAGKTRERSS